MPSNTTSMSKKTMILILAAVVFIGGIFIFKSMDSSGAQILWNLSNGGKWLFPLVTAGALVDSINPCALSVLLLTIGLLFSLGQNRSSVLKIGGAYIFGLALVYVLIGLGILGTLHIFNTPHFMAKVAAVVLIAFGLIELINNFFPAFPIKLKIPDFAHKEIAQLMVKASLLSAFLLGMLVGICEFPCTGGPYLMVLGLLHDNATYLQGFIYLVYYNLLFVLPLAIILLVASNKDLLEKVRTWRKKEGSDMRLVSGLAMILLGMVIFLM